MLFLVLKVIQVLKIHMFKNGTAKIICFQNDINGFKIVLL